MVITMDSEEKKNRMDILTPFKSIRTAMIFWFSLLIVIVLIIFSIISITYTEETVMDNSIEYTSGLVRQVNRDIDFYIDYMENILQLSVKKGDIQSYFFEGVEGERKQELYKSIVDQFNTVVETKEDIANIAVVTSDRRSIINDGKEQLNENISLENVEWYKEALELDESVLTASHVQHLIKNNYKWVVTLSQAVVNPNTGKKEGVFFIDLNYKILKDLCENNSMSEDSYIFIADKNGKIIYHPKQQLLYNGLKEEKMKEVMECDSNYFVTKDKNGGQLYTVSVSEKTGWRVVGVANLNDLYKNKMETQNIYKVSAVMLICAAMLLAFFLAEGITRPITELKNAMKEVEKGNFKDIELGIGSEHEIGELSNSFNMMTYKIRQLMEQNIYEQKEKRKSELKALRSQINPHFLYNTLDSIIWMAEGGKNKEVVLMTAALARMLRQSISNDDELISVEKEVDYVKSYLTIQQMRYKDKLKYQIEVEEDIKKEKIINLILQPIVENAIYHGIKYKGSEGLIQIKGFRQKDKIIFQISDNGIGMDEEEMKAIFHKSKEGKSGVGVYNVQNRIRLYYGEEYGLHFESVKQEGTVVTITIPGNGAERYGY